MRALTAALVIGCGVALGQGPDRASPPALAPRVAHGPDRASPPVLAPRVAPMLDTQAMCEQLGKQVRKAHPDAYLAGCNSGHGELPSRVTFP